VNSSENSVFRNFFFEANGWTRGQYALFRVFLGVHLLITNFLLVVSVNDRLAIALAAAGAFLSLLLIFGMKERISAFMLAAISALFFGVKPNGPHDSQQLLVFVLLAHTELAPTVRSLENIPWRLPQPVHALVWSIAIGFYVFYGVSLLLGSDYPALVLLYLLSPLAIFPRLRPWVWLLNSIVAFLLVVGIGNVTIALLLFQFFLFDPKWLAGKRTPEAEVLFYDGECGLCHRAVLFALEEDRLGDQFRFAPLQGKTLEDQIPIERRQKLPDSIVVLTEGGEILTKSKAVRHVLQKLGGVWRILALVLYLPFADLGYDAVAKVRKLLFRAPPDICPVVPSLWQSRFLR